MDLTPHSLRQRLAQLPAARRYRVAYSGGRDSHVLLHCMHAAVAGSQLSAIHVHHGLHPEADQWAAHCRQVCAALQVPLAVIEVDARPGAGESPEAAARAARYRALAQQLEAGDALVTAHHRQDQAETLLLQLLRGAGPRGLAAMPPHAVLGAGLHLRPLLGYAAEALAAYATEQQLHWIEDHSNHDQSLDRNFLRHGVAPLLARRWPAWDETVARAAVNNAEAARLADALGRLDLGDSVGPRADELDLDALRHLDRTRQANALRLWLRDLGLAVPSRSHLQRILDDVVGARPDAAPLVRWEGVEVRRYRDRLFAMTPLPAHDAGQRIAWHLQQPLSLPAVGVRLCATRVRGRGVRTDLFSQGSGEVRFRCGGERLRPVGGAHRRELKTLFQERGVAPWQRGRIPLLYVGDQLAAVGDLWVEHTLAAASDQWGYELVLQPLERQASH